MKTAGSVQHAASYLHKVAVAVDDRGQGAAAHIDLGGDSQVLEAHLHLGQVNANPAHTERHGGVLPQPPWSMQSTVSAP